MATISAEQLAAHDGKLEEEILTRVIREETGIPDAIGRPGQLDLLADMTRTVHGNGNHWLAIAPTGTGKTFPALVTAYVEALRGRRTVYSTESLELLNQVAGKDASVVSKVIHDMASVRPRIAILKGFSNYGCARQAANQAMHRAGIRPQHFAWSDDPYPDLQHLADTTTQHHPHPEQDLVGWVLRQTVDAATDPSVTGDKATWPHDVTDDQWSEVSVSSDECPSKTCPLRAVCLPLRSREQLAGADIIVTNHSLPAIQAATASKIVIGNTRIGDVHNLILDEAHALPGIIRSQGSGAVSGGHIAGLRVALTHANLTSRQANALIKEASVLEQQVDAELGRYRIRDDYHDLGHTENPLPGCGEDVSGWADDVAKLAARTVKTLPPDSPRTIGLKQIVARAERLADACDMVCVHEVGVARWVAPSDRAGKPRNVAHVSPVDVAPLLRGNVYQAKRRHLAVDPGAPGRFIDPAQDTVIPNVAVGEVYKLNVIAMSATIPVGFAVQAGLWTPEGAMRYDSPFTVAYQQSAAFIPRPTDRDLEQLTGVKPAPVVSQRGRVRRGPKLRFDVMRHRVWAGEMAARLVEANRGSALVLAATTDNGKHHAQVLRDRLAGSGITVLSQWDGRSVRMLVQQWKQDPSTVLVGTRSLMTGIDAPGDTNTLTVIDRAPRVRQNPVDEARCEALLAHHVVDNQWDAQRMVYGGDAALLFDQACGRLIRKVSDRGMVAFLECRMPSGTPISYPKDTAGLYWRALSKFGTYMEDEREALAWLGAQAARRCQR